MSTTMEKLRKKQEEIKNKFTGNIPPIQTQNIVALEMEIPLESIEENPDQSRQTFNEETIKSLAESIKESGLLYEIVLYKSGSKYRIVSGHRRFRACKLLGLQTVRSRILDEAPSEKELLKLTLIENMHREDLNTWDKAQSLYTLQLKFQCKQKELCTATGLSEGNISKYLQIYNVGKDDPHRLEKIKQLGLLRSYTYFCARKKNKKTIIKNKGKVLFVEIINEESLDQIILVKKKVEQYLEYLNKLVSKNNKESIN